MGRRAWGACIYCKLGRHEENLGTFGMNPAFTVWEILSTVYSIPYLGVLCRGALTAIQNN